MRFPVTRGRGSDAHLGMTTLHDQPVLNETLDKVRSSFPPPAVVGDLLELPEMAARGVSFRGVLHEMMGEPRQDAFALAANDNWFVAVVADGIGSCVNSHHGAAAAVAAVARAVTTCDIDPHDVDVLVAAAAAAACRAADDLNVSDSTVSTTLTVAVIDRRPRPDGGRQVVLHAVGDSPAVLLDPVAREWTYLYDGGDGPTNVVRSWVPGRCTNAFSAGFVLPAGDVLVLASDGFTTPLGAGDGALGQALAARWAPGPRELFAFMVDLSFNSYHDDKTVVALWSLPPVESESTEPESETETSPRVEGRVR